MTPFDITQEACLNTSEARVANHAFTAKESVAHFCPPVLSNVLVMALGETGEIAFTHGCHPRFGYIVSLDGLVSSRTCTSLSSYRSAPGAKLYEDALETVKSISLPAAHRRPSKPACCQGRRRARACLGKPVGIRQGRRPSPKFAPVLIIPYEHEGKLSVIGLQVLHHVPARAPPNHSVRHAAAGRQVFMGEIGIASGSWFRISRRLPCC